MKTLIMLTKYYPFGSGEAFVENEMNIVAERFDRVILIACDIDRKITSQRHIPQNVDIIRIDSESKLTDMPHTLRFFIIPTQELKEELGYCENIKQRLFACYFESKSYRIYKSILKRLDINELKKDEVTIYSYWLFTTARVGLWLKKDLGRAVRLSFTRAHGYDLYAERNSLDYLPMRNMLLSGYERVCPCSDDGTKYLIDRYPGFKDKIITAFLGTKDYGEGQSSSDGVFRIVSCSRIVDIKRVDRIIDALAVIDGRGYKIQWTHIGSGKLADYVKGEAAKKLKNVEYIFAGNIPNAELMKMYRSMPFDVFVNVSSSEGLPVSIMEAISFGIPVIATDAGGTNEIVFNDRTGYLIPVDFTNEELAEKIEELVTGKIDIKELRSSARRIWEEKFHAEDNYKALCRDIMQLR